MKLSDVSLVPGVEHRDAAVNDVRLHVAEAGADPPLILLHGWSQLSEISMEELPTHSARTSSLTSPPVYASTKAAIALSKSLAQQVIERGIRVTVRGPLSSARPARGARLGVRVPGPA